jgi:hypothetical protein
MQSQLFLLLFECSTLFVLVLRWTTRKKMPENWGRHANPTSCSVSACPSWETRAGKGQPISDQDGRKPALRFIPWSFLTDSYSSSVF